MPQIVYQRGLVDLLGAGNFLTDTIVMMAFKSGYVVNKDHDFITDTTPGTNEAAVSGYARQTLASKTVAVNDTSDRAEVDCADVTFTAPAAGETWTQVVTARSTGSDATSPLIAQHDITSTPTNGGNIVIQIDSAGLFNITT